MGRDLFDLLLVLEEIQRVDLLKIEVLTVFIEVLFDLDA